MENLPPWEESQQYEVLLRSIEFWSTNQTGLSSLDAWKNTEQLLLELGMISDSVDATELFTNDYLP